MKLTFLTAMQKGAEKVTGETMTADGFVFGVYKYYGGYSSIHLPTGLAVADCQTKKAVISETKTRIEALKNALKSDYNHNYLEHKQDEMLTAYANSDDETLAKAKKIIDQQIRLEAQL